MELILAILSIFILGSNYFLYRKLERVEFSIREFSKPTFLEVVLDESPLLTTVDSPPPLEPIPQVEDPHKHSAWVNRKGIPNTPPSTPQPPIPVRVSGPLERPGGFV